MLDVIVIGILVLSMYMGYRRGLIRTAFGLVSFIVAIILAGRLYPIVAGWLRTTPLFTELKGYITRTMGMEELIEGHTADLIGSLPVPEILRRSLERHNTPSMFELLNVHTIEEYIAGYFANMAINILSVVLVFILVRIIMNILSNMLDIVGHLPIIRSFNRVGGLGVGLVRGVLLVWIGLAVMSLFFINPTNPGLQYQLEASLVAGWIYENNPILAAIIDMT